jgi:hypothetical protein
MTCLIALWDIDDLCLLMLGIALSHTIWAIRRISYGWLEGLDPWDWYKTRLPPVDLVQSTLLWFGGSGSFFAGMGTRMGGSGLGFEVPWTAVEDHLVSRTLPSNGGRVGPTSPTSTEDGQLDPGEEMPGYHLWSLPPPQKDQTTPRIRLRISIVARPAHEVHLGLGTWGSGLFAWRYSASHFPLAWCCWTMPKSSSFAQSSTWATASSASLTMVKVRGCRL